MCACAMRAMRSSSVFDMLCVSALLASSPTAVVWGSVWSTASFWALGGRCSIKLSALCGQKPYFVKVLARFWWKDMKSTPALLSFFCRVWRVSGRHLITSPSLRLVCKFFWAILRFVRGVGRMYQNAVSHMMRMGRQSHILVVVWNLNSWALKLEHRHRRWCSLALIWAHRRSSPFRIAPWLWWSVFCRLCQC